MKKFKDFLNEGVDLNTIRQAAELFMMDLKAKSDSKELRIISNYTMNVVGRNDRILSVIGSNNAVNVTDYSVIGLMDNFVATLVDMLLHDNLNEIILDVKYDGRYVKFSNDIEKAYIQYSLRDIADEW